MYRPFITCDDPKGVVECGAIRKYRTSSQKMKDKTKLRRPAETRPSETSVENKTDKGEKVSKGSIERSYDPSSLQLMEVSRGAQRLNNMIDSWSKGLRCDGSSDDIAKDLLKGALDLQESLLMLSKVQEASQQMARLKRRQNEKRERGRIDATVIDSTTTHCNQFGEESYPMGFQRPWSSADGSSSSCTEELKKVIKESLVRQNLLASTTNEGLDSASAFHSTNSSQSSGVWNERLSDSSFSPTTSRKEKGPNLVAKLMGLEEAPSRSSMQKQLESQKILNQKRPIFEIDVPKVRKNIEKVNPEQKMTLKEILETTHFSGLLKKSSEPKFLVHHSSDHRYKQFEDLPPIVLIKPRVTPYQEFVRSYDPVVPQQELSLRNLKAKAVPSKSIKQREGSTTKMGKEVEEHASKRVTKEERTKLLREGVELEAKEIKPVENEKAPGGKVKVCNHVSHKSKVNEIVDKKAKVKTITISRKLPEKEVSKPKVVTKSQDQGEISSTTSTTKLRKPQSGSRNEKSVIASRKSTTSNSNIISKPKSQNVNNSKEQRKNQMKKQRSVAEPEAAKPVDEQLGREEEEEEAKSANVPCEDDCPEIRIITTIADDLAKEHEEVDSSENNIRENCEQSQSSSGEDDMLMLKSEHENDANPCEEAQAITNISETYCKPEKDNAELKYLLLTSPSFIGHAEELLNLDVDCPKILPKSETKEIANLRLYLDCANELTEHKSLQKSQAVHPLLQTCARNSRLHISLGKLVEEVYDAIENLTSYSENSGKKVASDNIYAMMERDIKSNNGMINGIWNWGWRHGFSADEADQVVNEVENLVLSELIEEVIVNV